MTYAIKAEGIGKVYRLGERTGARLLSEAISSRRSGASSRSEFHALSDVSFEIEHGTAVGIIGRNGAGKTTLLKLISRITRPTTGELRLRGRVGSLLEVGTGFHPELTGRENIFMNGSMLGMRRAEIARKFDEIVAFADVDRFIDTPVKRYSSGMYVRLAFAVAAHLEPEILVVDEVLAVGDAAFQRKCLGKMEDVTGSGRTVLFVSHSMSAVTQLTSHALLLDQGRLMAHGATDEIVRGYLESSSEAAPSDLTNARRWDPNPYSPVVLKSASPSQLIYHSASDIEILTTVEVREIVNHLSLSFTIHTVDGSPVAHAFSNDVEVAGVGTVSLLMRISQPRLAPGRYHLSLAACSGNETSGFKTYDVVLEVCQFEISAPQDSDGTVGTWHRNWGAVIAAAHLSYSLGPDS